MNLSSLQALSGLTPATIAERASSLTSAQPGSASSKVAGADSFGGLIQQFVDQSNQAQRAADTSISDFVTGKNDNIQDVAIAMANAEMSFQFFMEIRNKVIESFNELMRMPF